MKVVHKLVLPLSDESTIQVRKGTEFLTVGVQTEVTGGVLGMGREVLCLWFRFDDTVEETVRHKIRVAGTGHPHADGTYIGTACMASGRLVWHVFDLGEVG
jgi:hypothetical protein